jgi:hypothetical protein
MSVDLVAAGARLIGEPQFGALSLQLAGHLVQGLQVAADTAVVPDFAVGAALGMSYFHRHFMDIQPHIQYTLSHGLPPWLWLCAVGLFAHSLTHACKVRRPLTFNHYVYIETGLILYSISKTEAMRSPFYPRLLHELFGTVLHGPLAHP